MIPSAIWMSSCVVDCIEMELQLNAGRVADKWSQVVVSGQSSGVVLKVVYSDEAELEMVSSVLVRVGGFSFMNSHVYDYIPYRVYNHQQFCGELRDLRKVDGLFNIDTTTSSSSID